MSNIQSYNALIDRFKAFASGHFILKTFSHGQIDTADLEKFTEYPFMHVVPSNVTYAKGQKTFSFQIVLADLPRDKDHKVEFQKEVLSDLQRIAEDLVAEITNHRVLFGDLITVQNVTLEPFLEEFHNTLTGWTVSLDLLVPYYWDACSIPAEWNDFFESGSGGTGSILTFVDSITRDENGNVSLVNDEATPAPNYYYGTNDEGVRGWYLTTDNIGLTCETIGSCQTIIDIEAAIDLLQQDVIDLNADVALKANTADISEVGFSNDYNDLDNLPTIPPAITNTSELVNDGDDGVNPFITITDVPAQVNSDWNATSGVAKILNKPTLTNGTVTSVGLTMPSAFSVANSPITTSGTLAVTGAGTVSQYVRGDGSLANFPSSTGGGSSLAFYLNGSVAQGTIGGITFKEMDRVPILGAGTDFTINANGYIQSFITDANVPNLLEIPAGNWNFETYFSASSSGGSPSFYVELYKWNGTTLSLIASNSATPEGITNGTAIDAYFSALAVPQTTLSATDRLAIRIYVTHSGRTITLHTENSHLCQVITTFSTGLTALNGLTAQVQNFATGTAGTDFGISSATSTHTFNLPTASAANRGALSSADWATFNGKQNALGFTPVPTTRTLTINGTTQDLSVDRTFTIATGLTVGTTPITSGTIGRVLFEGTGNVLQQSGNLFWDNTNGRLGIGTATPAYGLDVNTTLRVTGFSHYTAYFTAVQRLQFNNGTTTTNFGLITASGNGIFRLIDSSEANFGRLCFGGGTTAYPALQRSGVALCVVDGAGGTLGNLLIGTTTDAGFKLDVNGTARVHNIGISRGGGAVSTNMAFGVNTMTATATGGSNIAIGFEAGQNITSGDSNVAIGFQSLRFNSVGVNNTTIGKTAGNVITSGSSNTAIGCEALISNITSNNNTAVGTQSLMNLTGSQNTAIGVRSGRYIADGSTANTTATNSVFLGQDTRALAIGQTNQIVIGFDVTGAGSNTATLGNTSIVDTILRGRINIQQYATGSRPTYVKGALIYDSTLGKLVVGGNAGWETITSI